MAIEDINPDDLVFVDESGAKLGMQRCYGRAPRGERLHADEPEKCVKNLSIIAALGLSGVKGAMYGEWATDQIAFIAFLKMILIPNLTPGKIVVLDNVPFHKCAAVQDALEEAGIRCVYLPPYSPDFSPVEEMWSKVKANLRHLAARTMDAFHDAFATSLSAITEEDIQGWYQHCGYDVI